MNQPTGYDEVSAGGWQPPKTGGHIAVIKSVEERKTQTGKDMAVVFFDFAPDDPSQPNYFANDYKNNEKKDKKWAFAGTSYIVTTDKEGKTSRKFKSFCVSFEKSNNTEVKWGADFAKQFKNKRIGVVFGQEEQEYNGEVKLRTLPRYFCDVTEALNAEIPEIRRLDNSSSSSGGSADLDGFMNIPQDQFEDLPFS